MNKIEYQVPCTGRSDDKHINIGILSLITSSIILILVIIFFSKIYVEQKQDIVHSMHLESEMLETFSAENINRTWYVIHILATQIARDPHNTKYIQSIFKDYIGTQDVRDTFCWKEFVWFDEVLRTKLSSKSQNNITTPLIFDDMYHEFRAGISYSIDKDHQSIYVVVGIKDDSTGQPIGSVLINLDITQMMHRLNARRKHEYTNVALIGSGMKVVMQSEKMENSGIKEGRIVDKHLIEAITKIGFISDTQGEFSYLDMITGQNFCLRKVKGLPFILLIGVDDTEIKHDLYHSVTMQFIEISLIAICFLLVIIFIYRRETWLRRNVELSLDIATKATDAKTDFLAFTAHEIRSPLGFILTGSEMMKRELLGPLPQSYIEYVDGIHQNATLILEFITDILDEAHILEGNFKVVDNKENLEEIIRNSIAINQVKFTKKNLTVDVEIEKGLPDLICDSRRILQIINNLLSNAAQYSFANTKIRIVAQMLNDELCIDIIDQGVGMTDDELKVAFAKYGTIRKKDFNFVESYGLGLPIVLMLLEAHNAKHIVTSRVNVGTSFKIIFPKERVYRGSA
jgi:signal transduction histidine kinase